MQISAVSGRELRDLDLTLHRGEIVGVAGITGSGREELCALLFGGRPRRGTVTVDGKTLAPMAPHEAVELGVGLVPADRRRDGLVMTFTVRENLTLTNLDRFWHRFRLHQREERRSCSTSIEQLGVKTPTGETLVASLSGGNQQKIVLGKWLQLKPHVLLLDEPTQGVDVASKAEVHTLVDRRGRRRCGRLGLLVRRGRAGAALPPRARRAVRAGRGRALPSRHHGQAARPGEPGARARSGQRKE